MEKGFDLDKKAYALQLLWKFIMFPYDTITGNTECEIPTFFRVNIYSRYFFNQDNVPSDALYINI
jgi:hypothetical protein